MEVDKQKVMSQSEFEPIAEEIRAAYHAGKKGIIWEGKKLVFRRNGPWIIVSPPKGGTPVFNVEVEKYAGSKILK